MGLRSNPWRPRLVPHVTKASFKKETNLGFFLMLLSSMDIAPVKLFTYSLAIRAGFDNNSVHSQQALCHMVS